MQKDLFFLAVLPPPAIQAEVTTFKEYAARHFRSSHALRSPPHITLIPPFRWPAGQLSRMVKTLAAFTAQEQGFTLDLRHFNCFSPRVIYLDIVANEVLPALQGRLRKRLKAELELSNDDRRAYHPHMTVAFKDLRRSVFPEAWAYFSSMAYERSFSVEVLTLLRHREQRWHIFREFDLGDKNQMTER